MNGWRGHAVKGAISLGLLGYLIYRAGGISRLVAQMHGVPFWAVVFALGLYFAAVLVTSVKWWVLARAQGLQVPWRVLAQYTLVAAFFNNFLPANVGGDVVRGYGVARYTRRPLESVVSVVMDRLVGLLAFVGMAALAGAAISVATTEGVFHVSASAQANVERMTWVAFLVLGALMGLVAVLVSRRLKARLERFFDYGRWLHPLKPRFEQVVLALNMYRHAAGSLLAGCVLSATALVLASGETWVLSRFLVPGGVPFLYILLVNPLIAFALLIPFSIGGLGVGQTAFVFFFGLVGVPAPAALALSLLHQGVVYLASIPGAVLWWRVRGEARPFAQDVAASPAP